LINKIINGFIVFVAGYIIFSCANPVTPSGGPKDTEPPKFIKSEPPIYSRNFSGDKIRLAFDEFIQLKDLNEQVIISPPMTLAPEFKLKGKSVIIEINDELKENTTYNIFFGNTIVDLTENNPIENFQFVFSTGNVIDSCSINGLLCNAHDLKPVKGVNIMLYTDSNDTIPFDSLPYLVRPYYMSKTDEAGIFSLNNLDSQPYKIFALLDKNTNLIYDQPGESIGFIKDLVFPKYKPVIQHDSTVIDSVKLKSIPSDQITDDKIKLFLFQETDSIQRLLKTTVPKNYQINFIFKRPVSNLSVQPINLAEGFQWSRTEYHSLGDTVTLWLNKIEKDSLILVIRDEGIILDTVKTTIIKRSKGKKAEAEQDSRQKLEIKNNTKGNFLDINKPLTLTFSYPLQSIDSSGIKVFENDTVPIIVNYALADSISRKLEFDYKWKKSTRYSLVIQPKTFTDIHSETNDSIQMRFTTKSPEDYGNLILNTSFADETINHIVQLLSGESVVCETQMKKNEKVVFNFIQPGKYTLKIIDDLNNNGKWDTGDYWFKRQPEPVGFFPTEIAIRANWDVEEDWKQEPKSESSQSSDQ
jgi:hypothetical protein